MILEDSVEGLRLNVFRRAEEFGDASAACREAGVSRALFQRWKTVYRTLRRVGLGTHQQRLGVLEHHSARRAGKYLNQMQEAPNLQLSTPHETKLLSAHRFPGIRVYKVAMSMLLNLRR